MKPVALSGEFYDTARIAFRSRQNNAKTLNGSHLFFFIFFMSLEESHFQASKRSNRGFVDARYL